MQRVRPYVLSANYRLGNYKDVHWIIGSGRSGSTWVSDMIGYRRKLRNVLEPYRPHVIEQSNLMPLHAYVRSGTLPEDLRTYYASVFSGEFQHPDMDSAANSLFYRGLLVKDVFASLFAKSVSDAFPQVKVSLLIRNPHDVAISMMSKSSWTWIDDPAVFLENEELVEDYLEPFKDLIQDISEGRSQYLKYITVWCISNYVPLMQFGLDGLNVLYYDCIKRDPVGEVWDYWERWGNSRRRMVIPTWKSKKLSAVSIGRKSIVNEPGRSEVERGRRILEDFGFGQLYTMDGRPNRDALSKTFVP
ncbi:MAG: sulfotransferase domain-containing protein [Flavobacteriia bacterium]|nr:sulfotransferase domain-containing protein [Flavobacteriia bacterium]